MPLTLTNVKVNAQQVHFLAVNTPGGVRGQRPRSDLATRAPARPYSTGTGSAVVLLISSIDKSAVTLWIFTSPISAW